MINIGPAEARHIAELVARSKDRNLTTAQRNAAAHDLARFMATIVNPKPTARQVVAAEAAVRETARIHAGAGRVLTEDGQWIGEVRDGRVCKVSVRD